MSETATFIDYSTTTNRGKLLPRPLDRFSAVFDLKRFCRAITLTNVVNMCREIIVVGRNPRMLLNNVVVGKRENAMTQDKTLDAKGNKIKALRCTKCGYETDKIVWSDKDKENYEAARAEGTLGHYGPNGNGYNYWCPKDEWRMEIVQNPYSALNVLFGFNQ